MYCDSTLRKYLDDAAAGIPAPGGGSVSALAGALGASMAAMAANFTVGKKKYRDVEPEVQAMSDDAPILHEDLHTQAFASATDEPDAQPTNVGKHFLHEKGDPEKAFAESHLVVEREFTTSTVHQGYIERRLSF